MNKRNSYSNEFKARVALESIKGEKTINEIASEYKINANMIAKWKKHLELYCQQWTGCCPKIFKV